MMSNYSYADTVKIANNIKSNVEKSQKLGENPQWSYFIAKQIVTPKKDVPKWYIKPASDSKGDSLNKDIKKDSYLDMAKRLIRYCDDNKQLPNYVTYQNYKIKVELYTYIFAKVLVYYDKNKQFPNYVTINSNVFNKQTTTTNKKYGHAKKSGCDNMGQNNGYYCACHSLQEVIRNLYNIVVPQSTIASWAGTTSAGTSHNGIRSAVAQFNKKYNKNLKIEEKNFSDLGWNGIKKIVDSTNMDCIIHLLYRLKYGHYETINAVSSNVNVQNSLGSKCSGSCYCGYIEYRTQSTFKSYINGISQKSILVFTRG